MKIGDEKIILYEGVMLVIEGTMFFNKMVTEPVAYEFSGYQTMCGRQLQLVMSVLYVLKLEDFTGVFMRWY